MLLNLLGEAEICEFGSSLVEEDVGGLNIAMDNLSFIQVLQSLVYLKDDFPSGLVERQGLLAFDHVEQVPSVAQLRYYVAVVLGREHLVAFYDVWVVHALDDFDLLHQQVGQPLFSQLLELDRLDRDDLV